MKTNMLTEFQDYFTAVGTRAGLGFLLALWSLSGLTAPVAITLFPDRATVTDEQTVGFAKGDHEITLPGFPAGLSSGDIRARLSAEGVRIRGVDTVPVRGSETRSERMRSLQSSLDELEKRKKSISADIESATMVLDLVGSLKSQTTLPTTAEGLQDLSDKVRDISASSRSVILEAREKLDETEKEIEALKREMSDLGNSQTDSTSVIITYSATRESRGAARVTYETTQAGWRPSYQASLDTVNGSLELAYRATIYQQSSQNWNDVNLSLSTGQTRLTGTLPDPDTWYVDIIDQSQRKASREMQFSADALSYARSMGSDESAQLTTTGLTQTYQLPGKVSLPADGRRKEVLVDSYTEDATVVVRTVPALNTNAYLLARATFSGASTLPAGKMTLLQDGVFSGQTSLAETAPGGSFEIEFGVDDRIEVSQTVTTDMSGEEGFISKDSYVEKQRSISVTNRHHQVMTVEVLDRIPVSRNDAIKVKETLKPEPATRNLEEEQGIHLWEFELDPGQSQDIVSGYRIVYPEEKEIRFQ